MASRYAKEGRCGRRVCCVRRGADRVKQRDKRGAVIPANPETSRLSVPSVLSDAT